MSDENTRNAGGRSGDDMDEMTRRPRLDDRTVDALFSGRIPPGCADHADVAALADALRTAATAAPVPAPSPALHALLVDGLSPDTRDLPVMVGTAASVPADRWFGVPTRRRTKKMLELLIAKLAGISLLAKTGIASAAVLAGTTGAGLTGALPPQAQGAFDRAFGEAIVEPADSDADESVETEAVETDEADTDQVDTDQVDTELTEAPADECVEEDAAEDCPPADLPDGTEQDPRPDVPGAEGRATADANAGDNGQDGRDTADEAAADGREFGERKADEAQQRRENAPAEEAQQRRETAPAEGRGTGNEASKGRAGTGEAPADEDDGTTTDADDDTPADDGPETAERGAPEDTPAGSTQNGGNASDSARQNAPTDPRP